MTAVSYNLVIEQGADFAFSLEYRDSSGALVNLTGYTARMDVRASDDIAPTSPGTPIVQLTTANGRITLGGALGTVALALTAAVTAALAPTPPGGWYVYDLELVSAGGVVTRLLQGRVSVPAEVTR